MPAKRECSACGKSKPLTKDFFPYRDDNKVFRSACLVCWNDKRRKVHGAPRPEKALKPVEEKLAPVEEHRLKKRVRELEDKNAKLVADLSDGGEYNEFIAEVMRHQGERPACLINPRERKSKIAEATPLVLASDWHVEEEVLPQRVANRNRYNLKISARRMERFFEAFRWGMKHQRDVFKIRDAILWLGGDFMTNFLHEDDIETNLLAPLETVLFLEKNISKGLDYLLEDPEIERYVLPCNDGNHGRTTKKMRAGTRTQHSLETLLYAMLAAKYKDEKRLEFILPTSQFTFLENVYGRTIRCLHGDVFKYAGGVGGITVPLFRAMARWEKLKHADLTIMGHWHQRYCLPDVMVNGSLIGYNHFAMSGGFPFEAPVQSMRILEPRRFVCSDIPLFVSEREDDIMNRA